MKPNFVFIMFSIASLWVLAWAFYVVLTRNIVRAAYALLAALFGVAVLYVIMEADFLAAVQVLIYVGGINILIIFGVMLTEHVPGGKLTTVSMNVLASALVSVGLLFVLVYSFMTYEWPEPAAASGPTTATIGKLFLTEYLLPFEVASVLLLAVLIGAVAVGRKEVRGE